MVRGTLSFRTALVLIAVAGGLAAAGCGGSGMVTPSPLPAPAATRAPSLTCALGTADCSAVMTGQPVTFTVDGAANLRSPAIDFGDGSLAELTGAASSTLTHVYAQVGLFTARLLERGAGDAVVAVQNVHVDPLVGLSLGARDLGGLNALATADVSGGTAVRYEWTFERLVPPVVTTVPEARYLYPTPGWKDLMVRVTLTDGRTITASGSVVME